VIPTFTPMPLQGRRDPFDDAAWLFELKYDGCRALAFVTGSGTRAVSDKRTKNVKRCKEALETGH
jgi:ATP-dependent DNA ligase